MSARRKFKAVVPKSVSTAIRGHVEPGKQQGVSPLASRTIHRPSPVVGTFVIPSSGQVYELLPTAENEMRFAHLALFPVVTAALMLSCGPSSSTPPGSIPPPPPPARTYTLSVSTAGPGSVTSDPAGISCGGICNATFPAGSRVVLAQAAAPGASFIR